MSIKNCIWKWQQILLCTVHDDGTMFPVKLTWYFNQSQKVFPFKNLSHRSPSQWILEWQQECESWGSQSQTEPGLKILSVQSDFYPSMLEQPFPYKCLAHFKPSANVKSSAAKLTISDWPDLHESLDRTHFSLWGISHVTELVEQKNMFLNKQIDLCFAVVFIYMQKMLQC